MEAQNQEVWVLADLGFGDQCKGGTVDALARQRRAHTVVRANGGAQALHHVVLPDGRVHGFRQFGAATFVPGVATHLTRFMVFSPWEMIHEEARLREVGVADAFERLTISEDALVTTPFHAVSNRLRELARGDGRHGSCGMGIGESMKDSLELDASLVVRVRDLKDLSALERKLQALQNYKLEQLGREGVMDKVQYLRGAAKEIDVLWDTYFVTYFIEELKGFLAKARIVSDAYLGEILAKPGCVIFEPAQGALLDEWRGFHPYTTWSTCTLDNPETLLREHDYEGRVIRLGLLRAYATRHGAGPFVTEDVGLSERIPDMHNGVHEWQGAFRVGHFDAVSARYAIDCCGGPEAFDGLVISCLDRLVDESELRIAVAYRDGDAEVSRLALGPFRDLDYQAGLTELCEVVEPVYETVPMGDSPEVSLYTHLMRIRLELGVPIALTSWGPTHEDKRWETHGRFLLDARQSA